MTGDSRIFIARNFPAPGKFGRQRLGAVFAVVVVSLSCVVGMMGAAFAKDDPATSYSCSPAGLNPVDPTQQNLKFVFEGTGKLAVPPRGTRVLRIPEGTQVSGRVDGGEGHSTTGRLKQVQVSVKIGVIPIVEKPDDTTQPWTVSLAIMKTEYDDSVLAKSAAKILEAEIDALDVRLGQWRSDPLPGKQKDRLQKLGTLTLTIDQAFDPESKLRPVDNPATVVVLNRPENPRSLYAKAQALRKDQDRFESIDKDVVKKERRLARDLEATEALEKKLADSEGSGLFEDLSKARALLLADGQATSQIGNLRWKELNPLQERRRAAAKAKESIKLYVDGEAQYVKKEPGRGFLPLNEVMARTQKAVDSLKRMLRDRYEREYRDGINPQLRTPQDIDPMIESNARFKSLKAKSSRLDKLKADFLREISEKDETIAAIDRQIADVSTRITNLESERKVRQQRYRQDYGSLDNRLKKVAADLSTRASRISLEPESVTPEALQAATEWVGQQHQRLRREATSKWQALETLFQNFLQTDQQLAVAIRQLLDSRERAARAVCKALAELDNSDDYGEVLQALSSYIGLMRYAPATIIMPVPPTWEIAIGRKIEDKYARRVIRNSTNKFLENLPLRNKFAERFVIGAKIYSKTLSNVNTGVKSMKVANALRNGDPIAIFEGLSLASSFTNKVPVIGNILGLSLDIYGDAGRAIIAAGNRIADKKVMEALAAVRERPRADSPERRLYRVADIKKEQYYKKYALWTSDNDVKRIATLFQAKYIIALLSKAQR
ncbi:MAG: hypothetical protein ACQ9MH_05600 [Nitrospinales bacterium]